MPYAEIIEGFPAELRFPVARLVDTVMNAGGPLYDKHHIRRREQDRAIGSVATDSENVGACPSDETLATFLEGKLTGKVHQAMLAHINHCPSCYYHWLEAASYLSALEPTAPRTSTAGSLSSIWQCAALERIQALLVAIEDEANEQTRANLSWGLEITLQQLSP